jgi:hypothetical protein
LTQSCLRRQSVPFSGGVAIKSGLLFAAAIASMLLATPRTAAGEDVRVPTESEWPQWVNLDVPDTIRDCTSEGGLLFRGGSGFHCVMSPRDCTQKPGWQVIERDVINPLIARGTRVIACSHTRPDLVNELYFPVAPGDQQGCDRGRGQMQDMMWHQKFCLISMSDCVRRGGHPEVGKAGPTGRRVCRGVKD